MTRLFTCVALAFALTACQSTSPSTISPDTLPSATDVASTASASKKLTVEAVRASHERHLVRQAQAAMLHPVIQPEHIEQWTEHPCSIDRSGRQTNVSLGPMGLAQVISYYPKDNTEYSNTISSEGKVVLNAQGHLVSIKENDGEHVSSTRHFKRVANTLTTQVKLSDSPSADDMGAYVYTSTPPTATLTHKSKTTSLTAKLDKSGQVLWRSEDVTYNASNHPSKWERSDTSITYEYENGRLQTAQGLLWSNQINLGFEYDSQGRLLKIVAHSLKRPPYTLLSMGYTCTQ